MSVKQHDDDTMVDMCLSQLGSYVRQRRTDLGLTQTSLGARIGWTQERVSILENARYGMPSVWALLDIAAGLDVRLVDLLTAIGLVDVEDVTPLADRA